MGGETVGNIQVVATINTKDYDAGKKKIEKGNDDLESSAKKTSSGFSAAWTGAIAGAVAAVVNKGLNVISSSITTAVRRVDTLNNSTRTFENMGFSAESSSKAVAELTDSIMGLPTPLDSAIRGMTALAATYGDLELGQKVFTSLNNAILGFGGTAAQVDNAITQLSQLPMDGPLDAQTWNSLRNSGLTPVLVAMAKESGMSVAQMRSAFGEGELTVQDFTDRLIRMNEEGGGGLKSLEQIAKDSTSGIGTGFANMETAVARGTASIIEAIGSDTISGFISGIGTAFEGALKGIAEFVGWIQEAGAAQDIIRSIAVSVGLLVAGMLTWSAITRAVAVSQAILNAVMSANPIMILVVAIAALVAALVWFFSQTETGRKIWDGFVSFIQSSLEGIAKFFTTIWTGIVNFLSTIWAGITTGFNAIVDFIKKWGLTILAVILFPFSLILGFIIKYWDAITIFFNGVVSWFAGIFNSVKNTIVSIFSPIVSFIIGVFKNAVAGIVAAWNVVTGFFRGIWNGIKAVFSPVLTWFKGIFQGAWNGIKAVFSPVGGFFRGIWNTIVGVFGNIGTSVGNAIGAGFKSVINGVLRGATNIINGFIDGINFAIGVVNNIPGVNIGRLGRLQVPALATGGIVSAPTLALIGEGNESEAVIPLSKLDAMLNNEGGNRTSQTYIRNVNLANDVDADRFLEKLNRQAELAELGVS